MTERSGTMFEAILADPPWPFHLYSKPMASKRTAASHYPIMPLAEIQALPVARLAAPSSACFLWTPATHLEEGIATLRTWGFKYKTVVFVWVKTTKDGSRPIMGMGSWSRAEVEFCLLGIRGKKKRLDAGVRQTIFAPRRKHSQKPTEQYHRIERLVSGPYVELFARETRDGWTPLGNAIDGQDITNVLARWADSTAPQLLVPMPADWVLTGQRNLAA